MDTDARKSIRKIIHIGLDCFYAAIETRDDPSLKGHPVVVGGAPTQRGIVNSANYEARELGIHAGMDSSSARQLCPKLFIILPEMKKYEKESKKIRAVFYRFTDMVEPLSLDETYLDVTGSDNFKGDALLIASEIRRLIRQECSLAASAGIASNKFLARVASDWKKPNGQFEITPEMVNDFVKKLPVKTIWEAGKETVEKMATLGLKSCGSLQKLSLEELNSHFKSKGEQIYTLCRGIDDRPVTPSKRVDSFTLEEISSGGIQPCDEDSKAEKTENLKESSSETPPNIKEEEEISSADIQPCDEENKTEKPENLKESSLEAPPEIKEKEETQEKETQEKEKIYKPIFELFKNAKADFIEIGEKRYPATFVDCELGKYITFAVTDTETYLSTKVSDGDEVVLRLVTAKGNVIAFESKLIEKRLPQLILTFPSKESIKFIRNTERITAKMSAKIIAKSSENESLSADISAMGSIGNVSDTGCSFTTHAKLEKHHKIHLAMVVLIKGEQKVFKINGTIQRIDKVSDQLIDYGIKCSDVDRRILIGIRKFMQSQGGYEVLD